MTIERSQPDPRLSFEVCIDRRLGREYMLCTHCAGYTMWRDILEHNLRRGLSHVLFVARCAPPLVRFIRRHLVCAAIAAEDK